MLIENGALRCDGMQTDDRWLALSNFFVFGSCMGRPARCIGECRVRVADPSAHFSHRLRFFPDAFQSFPVAFATHRVHPCTQQLSKHARAPPGHGPPSSCCTQSSPPSSTSLPLPGRSSTLPFTMHWEAAHAGCYRDGRGTVLEKKIIRC
jgi:hypothetical protein